MLFKPLNTVIRILNCNLASIGSQWSDLRTCVMWASGRVLVTIRAAVLKTFWIFWSSYWGRPISNELQWSNRDITRAFTKDADVFWSRSLRIFPMFVKAQNADLHILLTCDFNNKLLSIVTPRLWASGFGIIEELPQRIVARAVSVLALQSWK